MMQYFREARDSSDALPEWRPERPVKTAEYNIIYIYVQTRAEKEKSLRLSDKSEREQRTKQQQASSFLLCSCVATLKEAELFPGKSCLKNLNKQANLELFMISYELVLQKFHCNFAKRFTFKLKHLINHFLLMADHVVINVEAPKSPEQNDSTRDADKSARGKESLMIPVMESSGDESELLISAAECRICQEEDTVKNLETPCACNGSLKYAHRVCVERWCNEKGDINCEICHQPYKPDYTVAPRAPPDETIIGIGGGWAISGTQLNLQDPRVLEEAQQRIVELQLRRLVVVDSRCSTVFRSILLILVSLLALGQALSPDSEGDDDDASTLFSLFLHKAAGILVPCFIMAWAIGILLRQRQLQATALVPTDVEFILQSSQARPPQFNVVPEPVTLVPEPVTPSSPQRGTHQ
ncbi:RING/FYVE/PHD zinc finger superfamily protein [Rhynchospora pubera]|uniref:RING/FYVE/PHD zinc finger superfamily protein n=1 Tax=Rhynchospora pubera TaxID=906938 RepID=A0AAV8GYG6_9POAL|nr:RING/FYVE/PHD zinc finger superfamily protein [Rhynchospora pubera]